MNNNPIHRRPAGSNCGFTLIELLVVVSIIALLVSILLPALNKARQQAYSVACLAHLRAVGQGLGIYTADSKGWLPGPNTSNKMLSIKDNWSRPDIVGNTSSSPVQNVDWVSPVLGESLGLPGDRKERIKQIFNTDLRCPANKLTYDLEYAGGGTPLFDENEVTQLSIASYGAIQSFHVLPFWEYKSNQDVIKETNADTVALRKGYRPQMNRIGRASEKVFAMDGTRYISSGASGLEITFNSFIRQLQGGNYMHYGPTIKNGGDPWVLGDYDDPEFDEGGATEKYSFRHGKKINANFFDGHCETMDLKRALDIRLYFPRGSQIVSANRTFDPRDSTGSIIK